MSAKKLVHAAKLQNTADCDVTKPLGPWENPFDIEKMSPTIVETCGKVALFVYGRKGVEYDIKFFHNVL
jgi:hypothetical protein